MTPRERAIHAVRLLVTNKLANTSARVYLIGSSARGDSNRYSDIDIAVETLQATPETLIPDIRCLLEQSDIPFFVDVFDFTQLDELYRQQIKKEGVLWTMPPER